jgi:transcriptional regulator with XRE-family HTH domain
MSPISLADLLITHRKRLGLSQEELAEAAKLSLRTVQRLEKGASLPRGFTLQALAQALQLPVEALTTLPAAARSPERLSEARAAELPAPTPAEDVPRYVAFMYLSALSYVVLPGANIVLPLWLRYRKRHVPQIQAAGSQLLNFELVWSVVTYGGYLVLLAAQIGLILTVHYVIVLAPLVFLFSLHLLHAPLLLLAAWRARQGRYRGYPVGIDLF